MDKRLMAIVNLVVMLAQSEGIRYELLIENGLKSVQPQQWLVDFVKAGLTEGVQGYTPNTAVKTKGIPEAMIPHGVGTLDAIAAEAAMQVPPPRG